MSLILTPDLERMVHEKVATEPVPDHQADGK